MLRVSALLLFCCAFFACASLPKLTPLVSTLPQEQVDIEGKPEDVEAAGVEEDEEEGRSVIVHILLYLPNRVLDVFDIARAGVSVGPGIGIDLTATEALNLTLMMKASVGLGFQTLRHLPVEAAAYSSMGLGPFKAAADPGLAWYRSSGDIRVELHALLVGAHAALEPIEMLDLVLGFVFVDIKDDDL